MFKIKEKLAPWRTLPPRRYAAVKWGLFVLFLLPAAAMAARLALRPPADPIDALMHTTGEQALRMLIITLAITPLRYLTGWTWPVRLRRMCGLFAFFYAALHFGVYFGLDLGFSFADVADDIAERKYITAGIAAFLPMIALAVTSNRASIKRLGARWVRLHRAVYFVGVAACVHYLWLNRGEDMSEPLIHLLIVIALLAARWRHKKRGGDSSPAPQKTGG